MTPMASEKTCTATGCHRPFHSRGLCSTHARQAKAHQHRPAHLD